MKTLYLRFYKIISLGTLLLCFNGVSAQEDTTIDKYKSELDQIINLPNSPEAQAFTKYGNTNVNLYSGIPEINIPLYTINGREMNLPINLSYDASGIKVEQMATWVGLGWNLNVGGRISRIVNGLADDPILGNYETINNPTVVSNINKFRQTTNTIFSSQQEALDYFEFLGDINTNFVDAQPDYYSINVPGINETFILDINDNNTPKTFNNPRIKIERIVMGLNRIIWKVTGENGTLYYFDEKETILKQGDDSVPNGIIWNEYESSWLLTKIVSSNKKDVYEFNYQNFGYWDDSFSMSPQLTSTEIIPGQTNYTLGTPILNNSYQWVNQSLLTSIYHNNKLIIHFKLGKRYDIKDDINFRRLKDMVIYNPSGDPIKEFEFNNDNYFNLDGGDPSTKDWKDIRLKLDSISVKNGINEEYQNYIFNYNTPDNVPGRTSMSQDYLGYYNGAGNSTLIPSYTIGDLHFSGGDRNPSTQNHTQTGILTKITYPTGGVTKFEYEPHRVYTTWQEESTASYLFLSLNGLTATDPDLYSDSMGNDCDDGFLPYPPKIVIKSFNIDETGYYDVNFTGPANTSRAYILSESIQNFCDAENSSAVVSMPTLGETILHLSSGQYSALLLLDETSPNNYGSTSLSITQNETNTISQNKIKGGHRIKSIKDYANELSTVPALTKFYSYIDSNNNSTGVVNYSSALTTTKTKQKEQANNLIDVSVVIRRASINQGDQPFVVYRSVKESILDRQNNSNGTTIYNFNLNTKGATPKTKAPYENNFYASISAGEFKSKTAMDLESSLVLHNSIDYYETQGFTVHGFVTYVDESLERKRVLLKEYNSGMPNYYVAAEYVDDLDCGGGICAVPNYISNPQGAGYLDIIPFDQTLLKGRYSVASSKYGGISKNETIQYLENASSQDNEVISTEEVTYGDATNHYLAVKKTNSLSNGDTLETQYTYPTSGPLFDKNNLVEVVENKTTKLSTSSKTVSVIQKEYTEVTSGVVLPHIVKIGKDLNTINNFAEFTYHNSGNIKTSKRSNGTYTYYVWGYQDMYPIAMIENFTEGQATTIQNIINVAIAASNIDDDSLSETALRDDLDAIRTNGALINAQMTSYTYDPLIGVTSITDVRGKTQYYYYDSFGRLDHVKDNHGKVLSKNEYHYRD